MTGDYIVLCKTDDLRNKQARSFTHNNIKVFIIRIGDGFYGYQNNCPHQNIPLDWGNDQFLDYDEELIQCSSHGALFVIESGICVSGPCVGSSLIAEHIKVIGNKVCWLPSD